MTQNTPRDSSRRNVRPPSAEPMEATLFNPELEQSLLATLILLSGEPDKQIAAFKNLKCKPVDFADEASRLLFEVMIAAVETDGLCDVAILHNRLKQTRVGDKDALAHIGGASFVAEVLKRECVALHWAAYDRQIKELSRKRQILSHAQAVARDVTTNQTADELQQRLRDMDNSDDWPPLKDLPSGECTVAPFDFEMLPADCRLLVQDISERMQCPPDFPAVAVVTAMAGIVGNRVAIRPKRQDDWVVVPNLWACIVGRPGIMKSASIAEPIKILKRLQAEKQDALKVEIAKHTILSKTRAARLKHLERSIQKAITSGDDATAEQLANEAHELEQQDDEGPSPRRYLVNDATVQSLGVCLQKNPHGVTVVRDELVGLLKSLDAPGQEAARAFYLEGWSGLESAHTERIGRPPVFIENVVLSILGGTQPAKLETYVRQAMEGKTGDDGLIQRFQLLVWPDVEKDFRNVDRWPEMDAKNLAWQMYQRLDELAPETCLAECPDDGPPFLRFDDEAQALFDDWRLDLERKVRSGELPAALESHLAKYRSLVPTLALLFHLCDDQPGPVSARATQRALLWMPYLESHARKVYGAGGRAVEAQARLVADRIKSGELVTGFTARDVYRPQRDGIVSAEQAADALKILEEAGWVRRCQRKNATGRPETAFAVNPSSVSFVSGFQGSN